MTTCIIWRYVPLATTHIIAIGSENWFLGYCCSKAAKGATNLVQFQAFNKVLRALLFLLLWSIPEISFYAMWTDLAMTIFVGGGQQLRIVLLLLCSRTQLRHEPFTNAEMFDSNVVSIVRMDQKVEDTFCKG